MRCLNHSRVGSAGCALGHRSRQSVHHKALTSAPPHQLLLCRQRHVQNPRHDHRHVVAHAVGESNALAALADMFLEVAEAGDEDPEGAGSDSEEAEVQYQTPPEIAAVLNHLVSRVPAHDPDPKVCTNCARPLHADPCPFCGHHSKADRTLLGTAPVQRWHQHLNEQRNHHHATSSRPSSSPTPSRRLKPKRRQRTADVLLVFDELMMNHRASLPPYPERPERLAAILNRLEATGLTQRCTCVPGRDATDDELFAVHAPSLVRAIQEASQAAAGPAPVLPAAPHAPTWSYPAPTQTPTPAPTPAPTQTPTPVPSTSAAGAASQDGGGTRPVESEPVSGTSSQQEPAAVSAAARAAAGQPAAVSPTASQPSEEGSQGTGAGAAALPISTDSLSQEDAGDGGTTAVVSAGPPAASDSSSPVASSQSPGIRERGAVESQVAVSGAGSSSSGSGSSEDEVGAASDSQGDASVTSSVTSIDELIGDLDEGLLEPFEVHPDTLVSAGTYQAARRAAGSAAMLAQQLVAGQCDAGMALVRPLGHHATSNTAQSGCYFNNAAVAAVAAQEAGAERVLILDWDVHHGQGTQEIFEGEDSVVYVSFHRADDEFYPGTGAVTDVGTGEGQGSSVNIPWPEEGMGDTEYLQAMLHIVLPIAYELQPDIIIVSAGFSAAEGDPAGDCRVTPAGFAHMTHMLKGVAPVAMVLEGGYNLDVTARCVEACVRVLLGERPPTLDTSWDLSPPGLMAIMNTMQIQSRFWQSMHPLSLNGWMTVIREQQEAVAQQQAAELAEQLYSGEIDPETAAERLDALNSVRESEGSDPQELDLETMRAMLKLTSPPTSPSAKSSSTLADEITPLQVAARKSPSPSPAPPRGSTGLSPSPPKIVAPTEDTTAVMTATKRRSPSPPASVARVDDQA